MPELSFFLHAKDAQKNRRENGKVIVAECKKTGRDRLPNIRRRVRNLGAATHASVLARTRSRWSLAEYRHLCRALVR